MSRARRERKREVKVSVRSPFPPHALYDLWGWVQACLSAVADDFSPTTVEEFIEWHQELAAETTDIAYEGKLITIPLVTTWGVWGDDEALGGYARFERDPIRLWTGNAHCVFRKDFWGRRITVPALTQVAREIFAVGVERIQMGVFATNTAMQGLIAAAGAVQEGRLRMQTLKGGKYADIVVYGVTPDELEKAASKEG